MRRGVIAVASVAAAVALALAAPGAGASSRRATDAQRAAAAQSAVNQARAIAAYQAMQRRYYDPGTGLYRGATAWPYSQAMAATISVAALAHQHANYRPDLIARLSGLQAYADHTDPAPAGFVSQLKAPSTGGSRFNDDNEWIGVELIRLFHINRQRLLLLAAGGLMQMVYAQWDTTPGIACPGGVPWEKITVNGDRNTVSNATGAELGAQLYLRTGQASFLQEAEAMYNWVRSCLVQPNGLYGDHIDSAGEIDPTEWTYNQGTMIGAGVMLYQATHQAVFLQQAEATGLAALSTYSLATMADQPVSFNAIYVRNLLLLGAASGNPVFGRFAQYFANDAWHNVRDFDNNLFLADPGGSTRLIDQAAMTQVYALLAEPVDSYF